MEVSTRHGPARLRLEAPTAPRFLLALTHGAGGDADSADLRAAERAALSAGGAVAAVTQPYRVAGRRAPGSADRQDEAWIDVVHAALEAIGDGRETLLVGGRSNGARVACRTAEPLAARGVLALAFPLHPPGKPERSRIEELRAAGRGGARVLVVNGDRDPFGVPDPESACGDTRVEVLSGETHALRRKPERVNRVVAGWLAAIFDERTSHI